MAKHLNTDDPIYHLNNGVLTAFLSRWLPAPLWLIELTGGEPMLYSGIESLLDWLSLAKYKVHLRTNGIIPTKPRSGLKRIVAFHDLKKPPTKENADVVLIIDKIESDAKVAYCKEKGLPFKVIGFNKENPDNAGHQFKRITYIDPSGHNVGCPSVPILHNIKHNVDMNRMEYGIPLRDIYCCPNCKAAIDAWRFL